MKYHVRDQAALMVRSLDNPRQLSGLWSACQQASLRGRSLQQMVTRIWEGRLYDYFGRWVAALDARKHAREAANESRPKVAEFNTFRNEALESRADHYFLRLRFHAWRMIQDRKSTRLNSSH